MVCGIVMAVGCGAACIACLFAENWKGLLYSFIGLVLGFFLIYDLPRLINRPDMIISSQNQ